MIRRLLPLGLLLAAIAGPARAQSDPVLDRIVANARARIGVNNEGWTITDARAEGRTLVLGVAPPADTGDMFTPQDLAEMLAIGMCQSTGGRFFSEGRALRVEFSGAGAAPASASFRTCPTATQSDLILRGTARGTQRLVGTRFGPMRIAAAHVEGSELVVTIDGDRGWRRRYPPERVAREFFTGYCGRAATLNFLSEGRTIRVDTLESGANRRRGASVSNCAAYRPR